MNLNLKKDYFYIVDNLFATKNQLDSYNNCPHDPYMGNGTRYKRFSQFKALQTKGSWKVELLPSRPYTAFEKFNSVGGGFSRPYEPIEADFTDVIVKIINLLELDPTDTWQLNVHQNRSIANSSLNGLLTPEGRHTDGHEFVSISVFARNNIKGGETRLWTDLDSTTPLFTCELKPGQTILLHDKKIMHDVTDIEASSNLQGARDILIIAYSRWEHRWYGEDHDNIALKKQKN